jgi:hypothetical protein
MSVSATSAATVVFDGSPLAIGHFVALARGHWGVSLELLEQLAALPQSIREEAWHGEN